MSSSWGFFIVNRDGDYPLKAAVMCCFFLLIRQNYSVLNGNSLVFDQNSFSARSLKDKTLVFELCMAFLTSSDWYLVYNCGDFSWKQLRSTHTQEQMPISFSSSIYTTTSHSSLDRISIVWELDASHVPKGFTEPENNSKRKREQIERRGSTWTKTQSLVRV